jgi:chromosome segregation ATPase
MEEVEQWSFQDLMDEVEALSNESVSLSIDNDRLRSRIEELEADNKSMCDYIADLEEKVNDLKGAINIFAKQIQDKSNTIRELEEEVAFQQLKVLNLLEEIKNGN